MNTPYPEVNLFMQRLFEVFMQAKYAASVSRYHAAKDECFSKVVLCVTYLSGLVLLISGLLPELINPRHASLIGGIVILTVEIIRRLADNVFHHREKALAFRAVYMDLDQVFSSHELSLVKILKGALNECEIISCARELSDETNEIWCRLSDELNLKNYPEFAKEANLASDAYFNLNHNFSPNEQSKAN